MDSKLTVAEAKTVVPDNADLLNIHTNQESESVQTTDELVSLSPRCVQFVLKPKYSLALSLESPKWLLKFFRKMVKGKLTNIPKLEFILTISW